MDQILFNRIFLHNVKSSNLRNLDFCRFHRYSLQTNYHLLGIKKFVLHSLNIEANQQNYISMNI